MVTWSAALSASADRAAWIARIAQQRMPVEQPTESRDAYRSAQAEITALREALGKSDAPLDASDRAALQALAGELIDRHRAVNVRKITVADWKLGEQPLTGEMKVNGGELQLTATVNDVGDYLRAGAAGEIEVQLRQIGSQNPPTTRSLALRGGGGVSFDAIQRPEGEATRFSLTAHLRVAAGSLSADYWPFEPLDADVMTATLEFPAAAQPPPPPVKPAWEAAIVDADKLSGDAKRFYAMLKARVATVRRKDTTPLPWIDWYLGRSAERPAGFEALPTSTPFGFAQVEPPTVTDPRQLLIALQNYKAQRVGGQATLAFHPDPEPELILPKDNAIVEQTVARPDQAARLITKYGAVIELYRRPGAAAGAEPGVLALVASKDDRGYRVRLLNSLAEVRGLAGEIGKRQVLIGVDEGVGAPQLATVRAALNESGITLMPALAALNTGATAAGNPWNRSAGEDAEARIYRSFYLADPDRCSDFAVGAAEVYYVEGTQNMRYQIWR